MIGCKANQSREHLLRPYCADRDYLVQNRRERQFFLDLLRASFLPEIPTSQGQRRRSKTYFHTIALSIYLTEAEIPVGRAR